MVNYVPVTAHWVIFQLDTSTVTIVEAQWYLKFTPCSQNRK